MYKKDLLDANLHSIDKKEIWRGQVKQGKIEMGFKEWEETLTSNSLFDLIKNQKNVFLINHKQLGLKDIVIIKPI